MLATLASTTILGNEGSVIWLCVVSETPLRQLAVCMRGNLVRSMIRGWHVIIFLSSFRSIGTITTAISSMMPPTNHSGWEIPRPSRLGLQSGSLLEKSTTIRLTDAKPGTRPGTIWGRRWRGCLWNTHLASLWRPWGLGWSKRAIRY